DFASVDVTEPELRVYLPHVFTPACGSIISWFDDPPCEQVHSGARLAYRPGVSARIFCIECVAGKFARAFSRGQQSRAPLRVPSWKEKRPAEAGRREER